MLYASDYLRRASAVVGTVVCGFAREPYEFLTAFRTMRDKLHLLSLLTSFCHIYTNNLRYYLPTLFNEDAVAEMKVVWRDEILVVQRSTFHYRPGELHRFHICNRSDRPCSTYLISDILQNGGDTLCLEFVCYSPPRRFRCEAKSFLLSERIHFQHYPIRGNRQMVTLVVEIPDEGEHFFYRTASPGALRHLESPFFAELKIVVVAVGRQIVT